MKLTKATEADISILETWLKDDSINGKIAEALNNSKAYSDSQIEGIETHSPIGGPTEERPLDPFLYGCYFDTTLGIPIWWDGTKWVDAGGVAV